MPLKIESGGFDNAHRREHANPEAVARSSQDLSPIVSDFFQIWIADKVPPTVRRAQARDYRKHIEKYVLPDLGEMRIAELSEEHLIGLRARLLARGLSIKFVRNILSASFRAMVTAAVGRRLLTVDPYLSPLWRKWPENQDPDRESGAEADPFTLDERRRIFGYFEHKVFGVHGKRRAHPTFLAYVKFLFLTGARPSEASGLRWEDVALDRGFVIVRRSFHLGSYGKTKTKRSKRIVELDAEVIAALRVIQPLHVVPAMPVFVGTDGRPIEPKTFSDRWYDCLRALGVRQRGIYCMKDTFVSTALAAGVNVHWLEAQTGVRIETLKRHYWRWMRTEVPGQLSAIRAFEKAAIGRERASAEGSPSVARHCSWSLLRPLLWSLLGYHRSKNAEESEVFEVRGGGLEPPRVLPH